MTNNLHRDLEIVGDGIDHISTLPNELLYKILSYMDTKNVIRTIFLSKRWKRLSPFKTPPIKLDLYNCFRRECGCSSKEHYLNRFIDFVANLLYETLRDGPSVDTVFLSWCGSQYNGYEQDEVDKENVEEFVGWINAVLRLNVRDLTLGFLVDLESSFIRRGFTDIIHSLNGCVTLVKLNLMARGEEDDRIDLHVPGEFILPNLKSLFLYSFAVDVSVSSLISGCPNLNELYFSRVMFTDKLYIRSPLLKIFVINTCFFKVIQVVAFDAPNIEAFVYDCEVDIPDWVGADFKNLHSAYIDIAITLECISEDLYISHLAKIVKSCSNATRLCLYLGPDPIMDLLTKSVQVSAFRNLTWLGIMKIDNNEFEALARFLNNVPTIQTLKLSIHDDTLGCYASFESVLPTVPNCLRTIEILNFGGEEDVVNLVEYFLKNGRGLQKVTLHCYDCQRSIQNRLLKFPKHSETTEIIMIEVERIAYKLLRQCFSFSDSYDKLVYVAEDNM